MKKKSWIMSFYKKLNFNGNNFLFIHDIPFPWWKTIIKVCFIPFLGKNMMPWTKMDITTTIFHNWWNVIKGYMTIVLNFLWVESQIFIIIYICNVIYETFLQLAFDYVVSLDLKICRFFCYKLKYECELFSPWKKNLFS